MKALAKKVLVAAVTVGFLTAAAATTNLSVARAEETKGNPCGPVVLGDEWGKNMPAYGWIHDYVVDKKAECQEKCGAK